MITVTGRDSCRAAHIPNEHIDRMTEHVERIDGRDYPYTRIFIKDAKQKHEYFLDVIESKKRIQQIIEQTKDREKKKLEAEINAKQQDADDL